MNALAPNNLDAQIEKIARKVIEDFRFAREYRTAVHEAGHAVVCEAVGMSVSSVHLYDTFKPYRGLRGLCRWIGGCFCDLQLSAVHVAGGVAEMIFLGSGLPSRGDFDSLTWNSMNSGDVLRNVRDCVALAFEIIDDRRADVERVSSALLRQRALNGSEVRHYLASPRKRYVFDPFEEAEARCVVSADDTPGSDQVKQKRIVVIDEIDARPPADVRRTVERETAIQFRKWRGIRE